LPLTLRGRWYRFRVCVLSLSDGAVAQMAVGEASRSSPGRSVLLIFRLRLGFCVGFGRRVCIMFVAVSSWRIKELLLQVLAMAALFRDLALAFALGDVFFFEVAYTQLLGHCLVKAIFSATLMSAAEERQWTNKLVAIDGSAGMHGAEFGCNFLLPGPCFRGFAAGLSTSVIVAVRLGRATGDAVSFMASVRRTI
jgi:hypothetical protein